jgi:antitoxin component of RelBE/YafQ-DinJ toxin-antitoxin module
MSIGSSGRIVIEVEPEVKRHLYSVLARDGMTLKDWFLREAQAYLASANQLPLELSRENTSVHPNKTAG